MCKIEQFALYYISNSKIPHQRVFLPVWSVSAYVWSIHRLEKHLTFLVSDWQIACKGLSLKIIRLRSPRISRCISRQSIYFVWPQIKLLYHKKKFCVVRILESGWYCSFSNVNCSNYFNMWEQFISVFFYHMMKTSLVWCFLWRCKS